MQKTKQVVNLGVDLCQLPKVFRFVKMQKVKRITGKLNQMSLLGTLKGKMREILKHAQVVRNGSLLFSHVEDALILVVVIRENFSHSAEHVEKIDLEKTRLTKGFSILIKCFSVRSSL